MGLGERGGDNAYYTVVTHLIGYRKMVLLQVFMFVNLLISPNLYPHLGQKTLPSHMDYWGLTGGIAPYGRLGTISILNNTMSVLLVIGTSFLNNSKFQNFWRIYQVQSPNKLLVKELFKVSIAGPMYNKWSVLIRIVLLQQPDDCLLVPGYLAFHKYNYNSSKRILKGRKVTES